MPGHPRIRRPQFLRFPLALLLLLLLLLLWLSVPVAAARDNLTLERKAALFAHDLETRFMIEGQVAPKLRVPTADRDFVSYNMPDDTYMTGIYLGTQALRYAATRSAGLVKDSADARRKGAAALEGLLRLHQVTGTPGFPARAFWPAGRPFFDDGEWSPSPDGKYRWRGDVSSDQITGAMYGFALFHELAATPAEKKRIARAVEQVAGRILDNGRQIVGPDGQVTTWGHYEREYVTRREPMNALLLLQHVLVAWRVTGSARFREAYESIARADGYAEIAVNARKMADPHRPGAVNHSDDVLLFLAYYPLLRYERDAQLRALYRKSLRRTWSGDDGWPGVSVEGNPFFTYIDLGTEPDEPRAADLAAQARATLERFPLDMKWNAATIRRYAAQFGFSFDPEPASPPPGERGPYAIDRRPKTWSAVVQDPYQGGERGADSGMEYQALDFLMSYWMGRYHGFLKLKRAGVAPTRFQPRRGPALAAVVAPGREACHAAVVAPGREACHAAVVAPGREACHAAVVAPGREACHAAVVAPGREACHAAVVAPGRLQHHAPRADWCIDLISWPCV